MDNMYEANDEIFDTLSFADLQIYSDPSSSFEEEQDLGNSFSSFRFKIFIRSPPPKDIVFFRKLISVPESNYYLKKSHLNNPKTPSNNNNDNGLGRNGSTLTPVVRPPRKTRSGKGLIFNMFGSVKSTSSVTMELGDLRSRQQKNVRPVYDHHGREELEEMVPRRRSGNWSRKLFGACIPSVN